VSLCKDIAICLRRLDYSETSQVLALLTREHGQQRVIAKGIKRCTKMRPNVGIDLLEMGHVIFSRRPGREDHLATLTEWRQDDTFPHLRRELAPNYAAQYAAEVTAQLTEVHDPHPRLFDALHGLLNGLKEEPPGAALVAYLWRMLTEIGLRPELSRCTGCGREVAGDRVLYFSSRLGGAVCRDCEGAVVEKRRVDPRTAHWLAQSAPLPTAAARSIFDLLDYHLTEIMARPPRLSQPLRQVLS